MRERMSEVVEIFEVCRDGEGRLACLELRKKRFRDQSSKWPIKAFFCEGL